MSGGGGSGRGEGAGPDSGIDCTALDFEAVLASPDPVAVAQLHVGELLSVELQVDDGPVVAVNRQDGTRVGSLTSRVPELLRCLQQGNQYQAEVLEIDGGRVRVRVSFRP